MLTLSGVQAIILAPLHYRALRVHIRPQVEVIGSIGSLRELPCALSPSHHYSKKLKWGAHEVTALDSNGCPEGWLHFEAC